MTSFSVIEGMTNMPYGFLISVIVKEGDFFIHKITFGEIHCYAGSMHVCMYVKMYFTKRKLLH